MPRHSSRARARLTLLAALSSLIACLPPLAAATEQPSSSSRDITGLWEADSSHGHPEALVRIEGYHGHYTGTVVRLLKSGTDPDKRCSECSGPRHNQPIVGMEIIWNLEDGNEAGHYRNGKILDPDSGKIYDFKATVSPDGQTLSGRGFIGLSLLGKTQTWQRRDPEMLHHNDNGNKGP
ncbi:DUF2147 domain-containing protein [Kushneria phosphatilytica]|nr:DUF2147 domain-containing protein [Kushneria phosphatilytica]